MSVPIIIDDKMKMECVEGNTLIQSYLDTFNKEIEGNDVTVQMAEMEQVEEEMGDEEGAEGTYFVDQQGHYYFQATADSQPVMTTVSEAVIQDNEITLPEDGSGQMIASNGESFQTVTIMPSETLNGEVCYVLIVQQPDKGQDEEKIIPDGDNNMAVYDFDENEELEEQQEIDSGAEDDKSKIIRIPIKKPQAVTTQHMCNYCNYTSNKRYLLSRHMKSHSEERPHKCSVCERGFKTLASLQNHVNTHTGTKPHKCRSCDSAFTTSGELVRHVRYRHTHERPHKCHECDYASVELSKLKRHVRCHTGERPYQCQHCTYASPDTFKLKRHLRTHTGEKPYECDACHMCFTQSNSLKAHKLTHNGDKPIFHCDLCPTTCGRKTDLRIHVQKLHTSEKPLKCKRCGKSFPDRYSYKLHNKTHEGEKCFKCEMCPYASVSMRHLNSHMLIHTDEKPFACEQCDQTFRQKQLLKRHQNLYHNPEYVPPSPKEKSHECVECRRQFRHKGNLIRHLAVHDPESSIHETSLALKLGRQKKIHIVDGQSVEVMQSGLESEEEEEMDPDSRNVMSATDMQQYVVLEVIEYAGEGGEGQLAVVSENYGEENFIHEELDESSNESSLRSKKTDMAQIKHLASEKDMENCFGFDDEEADGEEETDNEDHQLESLKLIPID